MIDNQLVQIVRKANERNTLSILERRENPNGAKAHFCDGYVMGVMDVLKALGYGDVTLNANGYIVNY